MFCPLHNLTEYSFLESGLHIESLFKKAKENNIPAIGITDKNIMMCFPYFYHLADKYGVKPIFGLDIEVEKYKISLIVNNEEGYRNLCKISTLLSYKELTIKELKEYLNGLYFIISTESEIFKNVNDNLHVELLTISKGIDNRFFYIGLEFYKKNEINNKLREFLFHYSYNTIAFPKILYLEKKDAIVLNILDCIKNNKKIDEKNIVIDDTKYFKNISELVELYTIDELEETNKISSSINFNFLITRGEMLDFSKYLNITTDEALKQHILDGLKIRNINLDKNEEYRKRLNYEYSIIKKMGYSNYFLIVEDYVKYSKNNNIPVGPGRGSACGSLISYVLEITDVDPIKNKLLFERFLNPDRQSMPDIDIDFSDTKREEVLNYIRNKHGTEKVANVGTGQTFLARQALRDVAKVFNAEEHDISFLTKLIVQKNNSSISLEEAYEKFPNFKLEIDQNNDFKKYFEYAKLIENSYRQKGINAAGCVLNNVDLFGIMPLFKDGDKYISQYEKDYLEEQGFLKMDILGLTNLSLIENCINLIKINKGENIDLKNIDFNETRIYELIKNNQTMGLFQIDTNAASNALKILKPRNFDELTAFISLDRTGPRQFIPSYAKRMLGKEKITYLDKSLIKSLEDTYGILVYQEQIMFVAQDFAGFTFAEADLLRRACAKKKKSEMDKLKSKFVKGSLEKGHDLKTTETLYSQIAKFSEYGFTKSHAAAYAMITAITGYLKAYYPAEFYISVLQNQFTTKNGKFEKFISEIRKSNIKVTTPNINISTLSFEIDNNNLVMPFTSIINFQTKTAEQIINERNRNGLFKSFIDFVIRMYHQENPITEKQIIKLIDSGCFDCLDINRKKLKVNIVEALKFAKIVECNENGLEIDNQFRFIEKESNIIDDKDERLQLEYENLGVMISDSLFSRKKDEINKYKTININEIEQGKEVTLACIYQNVKKINTKTNKTMCFISCYDEFDSLDVTIFPEKYNKYENTINSLEKRDIIIIKGVLEKNNKNNDESFVLEELIKL